VVLQFRVRQPVEAPVRAEVRLGETVLVSRRYRYVRPAEMVALTLQPRVAGEIADSRELSVHVLE